MIRIALPTGDLRAETAALLDGARLAIPDYGAGSRALRFEAYGGDLVARVFREKDIPVQVALGNYDLGVCGVAWVEELTRRFPRHDVVRICDLGFGEQDLWLAAGGDACATPVRIASEYPNIAETLARRMRLPHYRIFGLAGAADVYPPEDADLALVAASSASAIETLGLRPVQCVLRSSVWLVANRRSLAEKDLTSALAPLVRGRSTGEEAPDIERLSVLSLPRGEAAEARRRLRIALPDGHAQSHTVAALDAAGIRVRGYGQEALVRRTAVDGLDIDVKVIRPQDMPQQVAIGQFDLAITGRDVLFDHLVQFPSSPVEEVADLGRSRYGLAAIVKDVPAETVPEAVTWWRARRPGAPIRVASEFPNIADHFARERHLGRYSVIPIAGASEGFVPDDAEILIEGIETGSSVRANNLTVLERFFESTNIVIANKQRPGSALRPVFDALVERLRSGAAQPVAAARV